MNVFPAIRLAGVAVFVALLAVTFAQHSPTPAHAVFNDTDGDGVIDLAEQISGSNPLDNNSRPETTGTDVLGGGNTCSDGIDNDADGLTDAADPYCTDSDGDIVSDPTEVLLGSDPHNGGSFPEDSRLDTVLAYYGLPVFFCGDNFDNDLDGMIDASDPGCTPIGSDGDAFDDATEKRYGSDPSDANSVPEHEAVNPGSCSDGIDNDLDGMTDAADPACSIPNNDGRANAVVISGLPYSDGPLVVKNATREPGEPRPSCVFGGVSASVWYRITPSSDAALIADTQGSNFDTTLTVWQQVGSGLDEVACAQYFPGSRVVFNVSAGQTYFFQIAGYPLSQALPELSFHVASGSPPANDGFLDATVIHGLPFDDTADLTASSTEFGEPAPPCGPLVGASTVWYKFQPSSDTLVLLETGGSDFPSLVSVWRQTIFGLLSADCNSSYDMQQGARLSFTAKGGVTYFFQAARLLYGGPGQDGFSLTFHAEATTPAANNNFANATAVASLPFHESIDTLTLTPEPAEPTPSCISYAEADATAWYKYTPGADTILRTETGKALSPNSFVGIYTGTSLATLDEVGCATPNYTYAQFAFQARAGQTYYFQVGTTQYTSPPPPGPLTNATGGWGSVAGGVPIPPGPGPGNSTKLDFNLESFAVPACAPTQFTVQDPLGDFVGFGPPITPGDAAGGIGPPPPVGAQPDIASIHGGSDGENFCLTVQFATSIDPPSAHTDRSVAGYVSFDTDENSNTGYGASGGYYCQQPSGLGVDLEAAMFGDAGVLVPLHTYGPVEDPPPPGPIGPENQFAIAQFSDRSLTLIVPLTALGGDSSFNLTMTFGSLYAPSDCVPNGGSIHSPSGAVTQPVPPGDVNCNLSPGPVDASLILQLSAGLVGSLPCQAAGDVNGDGRLDSLDASLLLQFVARMIPSLPVPGPGPVATPRPLGS